MMENGILVTLFGTVYGDGLWWNFDQGSGGRFLRSLIKESIRWFYFYHNHNQARLQVISSREERNVRLPPGTVKQNLQYKPINQ